jgi:hypothetical protein
MNYYVSRMRANRIDVEQGTLKNLIRFLVLSLFVLHVLGMESSFAQEITAVSKDDTPNSVAVNLRLRDVTGESWEFEVST